MTKAENDYQYTLHNRIIDLEAENRRLNFIIEDYNQQFSLQGVSHQRELLPNECVEHWDKPYYCKSKLGRCKKCS